MPRRIVVPLGMLAVMCFGPPQGAACSLCDSKANTPTLREDATTARLVLFGTLSNPRLNASAPGASPDGAATDLAVERVIKSDPILGGRKMLTLPRYVPVDPKAPPRFLVFCDVSRGKLDPYRGCPASAAVVEYLTGALAINPSDPGRLLGYYSKFLDHPDPEVAGDAFREFARTGDIDIARAARQLDPGKLRKLLTDPQTPPERLSLFAYLLGGCGTAADADLLARLLRQPDDRLGRAYGGLLAGYTQLRPDDGWRLLLALLADPQQPFARRLAALGTVRFFYRSQPATARPRALQAMAALLPQGDLADLAVEDLLQWREWDLTDDVLAQYGKKTHDAPMVRRAIVRYALSCPRPEATLFVQRLRNMDRALVQDVEDSLQFEKARPAAGR
ncbi:MAG TPA: hypothetical protein VGF55_18900 [Gemmataceae bacterium]|jgi:hypothetical protein